MAKVRKFTWLGRGATGRKVRKVAYGYTLQIDGKQVKKFDAKWTEEDTEKALAARMLDRNREAADADPHRPKTLLEVGQEYVEFKRAKGKRTVAEDEAKLRRFGEFFGALTPITEITAQAIARYDRQRVAETSKRGAVVSSATVNRELALLRHLLRLAEEWGYIQKAPRIRMAKESEGRLRWLTTEESVRLLDACRGSKNPYLYSIVVVALNTGARKGEVLGLTWERVDFSRGVLLFNKTKSGRRREVPMNRAVYDALSALGPQQRSGGSA